MFAFKQVFASVLLAILFASAVIAAPYPASSKYATHSRREISPGVKIEVYHPQSTYEVSRRIIPICGADCLCPP